MPNAIDEEKPVPINLDQVFKEARNNKFKFQAKVPNKIPNIFEQPAEFNMALWDAIEPARQHPKPLQETVTYGSIVENQYNYKGFRLIDIVFNDPAWVYWYIAHKEHMKCKVDDGLFQEVWERVKKLCGTDIDMSYFKDLYVDPGSYRKWAAKKVKPVIVEELDEDEWI